MDVTGGLGGNEFMSIISILDQVDDKRKNGDDCDFNGYLEDYLNIAEDLDPVLKDAFTMIEEKDPDARICTGLRMEINRDAISNQIIRYKDVFKLNGKAMVLPFLIYTVKDGNERALLVVPYSKYSYIYAKGYYYCMTEPGSKFVDCKNEIVAVSSSQADKIAETYEKLYTIKAGALQRSVDREHFHNYDELKANAIDAAEEQKQQAESLLEAQEDRTQAIYKLVINWFLLKKVLYVQYMVNKDILNTVHEGNVKKQRNQAKLNADEIAFMSFSEMWRLGAEHTETKEEAVQAAADSEETEEQKQ